MRSKLPLLGALVLTGALALVSATQGWVTMQFVPGAAAVSALTVSGQDVNASLSPIAIAVLAAALALTIAGRVFRRVLGALLIALGWGIAAIALGVLGDPVQSATSRIAEITAITGTQQLELVRSHAISSWPVLTAVTGGLILLLGAAILVVSGRWRSAGRKYQSTSETQAQLRTEQGAAPDRISDWERQNDGEDPSDLEVDPDRPGGS